MFKYIGDSIINASFTVQVPKPLDSRTVVSNITELYSIPSKYAYPGMTVANIDNGNIYMLVDKSKINQKAGWKASYESIQIITCSYQEYKKLEQNTNELFQPIDDTKEYLHQDTYYYIYEDSLPLEEINQEYVKRSDWQELLNQVATKASNNAVIAINQTLAQIVNDYATKQFVIDGYASLSMFDLNNTESFIKVNFFTKEEALAKFVKFSDLSGGEDIGENDFIFVTASRYQTDQEALEQYKQGIANELANCLKVGDNGELNSITVGQIKSKKINNKQLVIDVTPQGMSIDGDPIAKLSDVPNHITLTREEYDTLVKNNEVNPDAYYLIVGGDDTYVLQSELQSSYYTKTGVELYVAGRTYSKQEVDNIINKLSFYTQEQADNKYVTKTSLETTLKDYVTIAMLGGDDIEGQFIFVKASDYQQDQQNLANQRQQDLQQIENSYIKKNSDASLNSLETGTIKNGQNTLQLSDVLKLNNKKLALDEDVPVIKVVTAEEYETLTKDPNIYYFIYNTNQDLAFVTAEELKNYYTKPQIDVKIAEAINSRSAYDIAVSQGFKGTEEEWIASLKGEPGPKGDSYDSINKHINFSTVLVQLAIKNTVEKISMERIADNQYYQSRVCGNHIDITEFAPDQSVLTTAGTGLISFIRHLITNDTQLGNDLITVTLSYNNNKVVMNESGSSSDNPSTVSVQMLTFFRQITGISSGDIKQSDLFGMIIDMAVNLDNVIVNYKIAIKSA